ncbi:NDR1/HIN1-like protein 3 [Gastrolobium bilobum]|uniref:NDR1/HIN1-like protein 3 n=1 Tax=Gastrolobium bilobum TaxID=150636 RepID=UPI002AB052EC|nr:NDR1/HIN1-like protein 3 [Gastrolobium bilobum]
MADKQAQLNGAYYGPSIPPPTKKSYHRPGRGGGGGCFSCCCGCIFNCIFGIICKLLTTIIIMVAIAAFLFWLIVRPNVVRFYVTDATLTQFNFTNNNTLHYNLALNITIRNPNKRVGIYYDYIEARALYQDVRFDSQTLGTFFQHHKNTSVLNTAFKGQQVMILGTDQTSELNKDKSSGVYHIDVMLFLNVRFKMGLFKSGKVKPKIRCDLQVPLKSHNGTSPAGGFQTTECGWEYRWIH